MAQSISLQAAYKKYDFEEKYTAVQLEDVVKEWTKPAQAQAEPTGFDPEIPY